MKKLLILVVLLSGCAHETGKIIYAPVQGEQSFCTRLPDSPICHISDNEKSDTDMVKTFIEIASKINKQFSYVYDADLYGQEDYWNSLKEIDGSLYGDCEDHAITIINLSVKAGIPLEDLALYVVAARKNRGADHILVEYRGWYADSITKKVMRAMPYYTFSMRKLGTSEWLAI